jgi:hypothetical protein
MSFYNLWHEFGKSCEYSVVLNENLYKMRNSVDFYHSNTLYGFSHGLKNKRSTARSFSK